MRNSAEEERAGGPKASEGQPSEKPAAEKEVPEKETPAGETPDGENSTAQPAKAADAGPAGGAKAKTEKEAAGEARQPKGPDTEKKISEAEVLKIYLQQSMAEIKRLKGEQESARKEKENLEASVRHITEKYNSLAHEYENYRRRTAEEKASLHDDAVAQAVSALLPALDSLERAKDFAGSNTESFQKGVEMTLRQLSDGFKKLGVEEIEAQSQPFNPDIHNAVMHVEDKNLGESMVADVFQKGYRIGERIIRHSMVKVAN